MGAVLPPECSVLRCRLSCGILSEHLQHLNVDFGCPQDAAAAPEVLVSDLMAAAEQAGGAAGDATAQDREIETESGDDSEGSKTFGHSPMFSITAASALTSYLLYIIDFL